MSKNIDKFKLQEDPAVAGGAGGNSSWNYCPMCGTTLRNGYCRRCEKDYQGGSSESNFGGEDDSYSEIDIPAPTPAPAKSRNRANSRQKKYSNNNYSSSSW